jgi:hypothetical protein
MPPHLTQLCELLNLRWQLPETISDWRAVRLRDDITPFSRGLFIAGVSSDTRDIREELVDALSTSSMEPLHVQGYWRENLLHPTISELYSEINACRTVVFLLAKSAGFAPASLTEDLAAAAAKHAFARPTYVVCEYLIATALEKQMLFFEVTDTDGRDELAQVRDHIHRRDLRITPVSRTNCVATITAIVKNAWRGGPEAAAV